MKTNPAPGLSGLAPDAHPLILDLLDWLAPEPRPYGEVLEAWRTSCPRLTIWEDAVDLGLVVRQYDPAARTALVTLTDKGQRARRRR
jgi:hypothetical protein